MNWKFVAMSLALAVGAVACSSSAADEVADEGNKTV